MINYTFDPSGINLIRLKAEVAALGGSVKVVRGTRLDGSPGVPTLEVSVPDAVLAADVQAAITRSTGVTDAEANAFQKTRDIAEAKGLFQDGVTGRLLQALVLALLDDATVSAAKAKLVQGRRGEAIQLIRAAIGNEVEN